MELKNITTDSEGLKKVIDFLDSSENRILGEESGGIIFYLESIETEIKTERGADKDKAFIIYSINIIPKGGVTKDGTIKIANLLKEIYK